MAILGMVIPPSTMGKGWVKTKVKMVIPPFIGDPYNTYIIIHISPYHWVDEFIPCGNNVMASQPTPLTSPPRNSRPYFSGLLTNGFP